MRNWKAPSSEVGGQKKEDLKKIHDGVWKAAYEIIDKKKFLTNYEKNYLKNNSTIKMCNITELKPIEFEEDKKLQGINIDLLSLMAKKLLKIWCNRVIFVFFLSESYHSDCLMSINRRR